MKIEEKTGLLVGVPYQPSPNCNTRPLGVDIDLIIVHNISLPPGEFGGPYINALFTNNLDATIHPYFAGIVNLKVSCHCLIRRDGSMVQYVPFTLRAWHAGQSSFLERENCNDYSIGIELEGADTVPYEDLQYETLTELVAALVRVYPKITADRIVGHSTVAPSRKTDPGPAFDWRLLMAGLAKKNSFLLASKD